MSEDLLGICNDLVKLGMQLGADEIEVFAASQKSIESVIDGNEMKLALYGETAGVGVRIFANKSLGFASTNSLEMNRLKEAVSSALALSKNAPPDIHNGLPDPGKYRMVAGLYDEAIAEMEESEIIDRASRMLNAARGIDERISVDSGRFEIAIGSKAIANSFGIDVDERFTALYYDIGAHGVEKNKVSSVDYRFDGARVLRNEKSEELSIELAEAVVESLSAEKVESFRGSIILSPLAAIDILISPILFCVDSNNVQKAISRFKDKKGEYIASPVLTMIDDGTVPAGLSSSSFDREGVPHRPIEIIDNGRLKNFLYDSCTANREGLESTGHATGGTRHVPSIDSTNISVKGGNRSLEDMIASIDRSILVNRFSGSVDAISGDFSGIAKASKKIVDGALGNVIRETMISGNLYDTLSRLREVSRETVRIMDFELPYFLADDISITGV